jgi:excisionase family DNA binding protein
LRLDWHCGFLFSWEVTKTQEVMALFAHWLYMSLKFNNGYRMAEDKALCPPRKKERPEMVPHPLDTQIYTTDQVAKALSVSVRTILRAIELGKLDAKKQGKQFLITREAVRKYWESLPSAKAAKE